MDKVRVRFAPSPTGPLHLGGVRTALYDYLFAKNQGGEFVLRIEDTDTARYVEGAEEYIEEALEWCGIIADESPKKGGKFAPYRQSERRHIYDKYTEQILKTDYAYIAFDTAEELDAIRAEYEARGDVFSYDNKSRNRLRNSIALSEEEVQKLLDEKTPYVVRFKMPIDRTLNLVDIIRGNSSVNTNTLDDKVLVKNDGMPTYHFANIVDDHLMEISHVIRGEEWLPSTALHTLLYSFFGWEAPKFAHLPLILKPDGKGKLSKRDGDKMGFPVFPLNWKSADGEIYTGFREQGYLPEAFINMLALLGWNPGTEQELFSLTELEEIFSLEKVNKSGARFDPDKTKWFQQQHLKNQSKGTILQTIADILPENTYSQNELESICGLMKERVVFAQEIPTEAAYFFMAPHEYDSKTVEKKWKDNSATLLHEFATTLETLNDFTAIGVESAFHDFLTRKEVGLAQVMPVLRLAITGLGNGPQIFEIAALLGKNNVISRIKTAVQTINQ
jgi:glutamyl-tRNA synthetase